MTMDLDRDIVTIQYNILNLPDLIQFKNGNQIVNKYDASGRKLHSEYYTLLTPLAVPLSAGQVVAGSYLNSNYSYINGTDYVGSIEYTFSNDQGDYQFDLDKVYNAEGYIIPVLGVPQYYYYRKDHTGDNREVWYANTNTTVQKTQYYASGLPWMSNSGDNPSFQQRKYNGKEFIEMHGYDVSDLGWRTLHHAKNRFDTFDPDAELDYDISPYVACHNNPVMKVDPNGRWVETAWDVFSLATGVASFASNVKEGNVGAAIVDGIGIVADAAAVVLPVVPGGVGVGIKALRGGEKVVEAVKTGEKVERVVENAKQGKQFEKTVIDNLKQSGHKNVSEQVTIKAENGVKTRIDAVSKDANGKIKLTEAKSSQTAPLTKNQKGAFPSIQQKGGTVVGKGKPGFEGGTKIPPTKIDIVRPNQ